jgi:glycosyltransferase involved in cell wall biosynthesis
MAESHPECQFEIIGRKVPGFEFALPPNMTLTDFVPHKELAERMAGYTFYCQLSLSEGFGVALAEAMACGCVPIVSRVGIMDFIAGDSGFILDRYDTNLLGSLTSQALNADTGKLGLIASQRIASNFDKQIRRDQLLKLLQDLT